VTFRFAREPLVRRESDFVARRQAGNTFVIHEGELLFVAADRNRGDVDGVRSPFTKATLRPSGEAWIGAEARAQGDWLILGRSPGSPMRRSKRQGWTEDLPRIQPARREEEMYPSSGENERWIRPCENPATFRGALTCRIHDRPCAWRK
jgi:hypothetical protein